MAAKKRKTKSRSKARKSPAKKKPVKRRKPAKRKASSGRKKARTPAQRKATEALVARNKARKRKKLPSFNLPPLPRVPLAFRGKLGDKTLVPGQYHRGPNDGGEARTLFMKPRRDVGVDFED